jgi:hypothetical protein
MQNRMATIFNVFSNREFKYSEIGINHLHLSIVEWMDGWDGEPFGILALLSSRFLGRKKSQNLAQKFIKFLVTFRDIYMTFFRSNSKFLYKTKYLARNFYFYFMWFLGQSVNCNNNFNQYTCRVLSVVFQALLLNFEPILNFGLKREFLCLETFDLSSSFPLFFVKFFLTTF